VLPQIESIVGLRMTPAKDSLRMTQDEVLPQNDRIKGSSESQNRELP
jgi:hypothetical protein